MRGFTLIEVLVTMLIISIIILATMKMLFSTIENNRNAETRIDASSVAHAQLNNFKALGNYNKCANNLSVVYKNEIAYMRSLYSLEISCAALNRDRFLVVAGVTTSSGIKVEIRTIQFSEGYN